MTPAGPSCIRCGAVLASDQEYCLECGTRQPPSPAGRWRVPLIAAAVTVALALGLLLLVYEQMRDDADSEAARQTAESSRVVKPAPASEQASGSAGPQTPPPAPSSAAASR